MVSRSASRRGATLEGLESVAWFFVSRVDTEVHRRLDAIADRDPARAEAARSLRGTAAIANARLAYEAFEESLATDRWRALAERGARPQRPLWASTGVKDPAYDDTRYVVELLGPETVNTMPELTLRALADHGQPRRGTARSGREEAKAVMQELARVGVDMADVTETLEREGLEIQRRLERPPGSLSGRLSAVRARALPRVSRAGRTPPAPKSEDAPRRDERPDPFQQQKAPLALVPGQHAEHDRTNQVEDEVDLGTHGELVELRGRKGGEYEEGTADLKDLVHCHL